MKKSIFNSLILFVVISIIFIAFSGVYSSQKISGSFCCDAVCVSDHHGNPLSGYTVKATDVSTNALLGSCVTGSNGQCNLCVPSSYSGVKVNYATKGTLGGVEVSDGACNDQNCIHLQLP